ncbi:MAG: site-specific integrase [Proteobacteria bacterium]|nr:site-specific integrase [Pseudomonadota bacterium]
MKAIDPKFLEKSRTVFTSNADTTLAEIRAKVALTPASAARRDTLSALDSFARFSERPLATIPANPRHLRGMLRDHSAARFGVSDKRMANIASLITSAVRAHGAGRQPVTTRIPLTDAWNTLLSTVSRRQRRMALYRLASFCSHMGVAPTEVTKDVLIGFYEALEAEELVKHPKNVVKFTIANWNMCSREVPGWPAVKLHSPFQSTPYTLPLTSFPTSFQADVAAWVDRASKPDVFDPTALKKPLKASTIAGYIMTIRRFASALVHRGVVAQANLNSLTDFFSGDRFKQGLTFFVERDGGAVTRHLVALATDLRNIAKHYCKLAPGPLSVVTGICNNLDNQVRKELSETVRRRLRQFDDPENVKRLLSLPAEERARGLKCKNLVRQARFMERALTIDILIHCCLRIQNLRTINLETDVYTANGKSYLTISAERVKNGRHLDFELPEPVAEVLADFLTIYRPRLASPDSPYLFAGDEGGPRSHGAMREALTKCIKQRTGLEMHPHLFRHTIGKIVVEQDPGAYAAFSQHLGHKRLDTTLSNYLGTETKAAGRHVNGLLTKAMGKAKDALND